MSDPTSDLPLMVQVPGGWTTPGLDAWRHNYAKGTASMKDHKRIYERIAREYPEQNYYSLPLALQFFDWACPAAVVELGGWDGALANEILARHPEGGLIGSWDNHEIVRVPTACSDKRYRCHVENTFLWDHPIVADAFVASHTLEHLSEEHLTKLIAALDVRFVYVDVPLGVDRQTWEGTTTTHVLPWSISDLDSAFHMAGFRIVRKARRTGDVPSFVRFMERGRY